MKNLIKTIIISLIFFITVHAQNELYIPTNIKPAYVNGTRSSDGLPGPNYWQNSSEYNIKVSIDPQSRKLEGSESIKYFNNSPDTLNEIVIRLYQNLNQYGGERNFPLKKEALTDGVEIEKFNINNQVMDLNDKDVFQLNGTNLTVKLVQPIKPNTSLNLQIEWNFIIPMGNNIRMGTYDSSSFFIAYWFPQISVYDDIDGWDKLIYNGEQEFYNDFSSFDVWISVPNTFSINSTGVLQNPSEIFTEKYFKKYNAAWNSDSIVSIISEEDLAKNIFKKNKDIITWYYKSGHTTDFAFALSDHYLWDASSIEVEPGRRVFAAASYDTTAKDFYGVAEIARKSVIYFSKEMPGISFPFPSLTVWNGSGGMEFPMMINDGSASSYRATVGVTTHEIAHQYFPFYMGTNEKKYAWMDEAWAVFLPYKLQETIVPEYLWKQRSTAWMDLAGKEMDAPLMIPSVLLKARSYRVASYNKPSAAYLALQDLLGEELFLKALQGYIKRWNGRHPIAYDFFYSFNDITGEDLNWFWKPWFFEKGYPDLGINSVSMQGNSINIIIENKGTLPLPVLIKLYFSDGTEKEIKRTAEIWKDGEKQYTVSEKNIKKISSISLGDYSIPDLYPSDNIFKPKEIHGSN